MRIFVVRVWLAVVTACLSAAGALAQTVGVATSVTSGAFVETDDGIHPLAPQQTVASGDVILTDNTGTAQLTFKDRTRVVVGPNTRFEIKEVSLDATGSARRFSVTLLGGVFRFLSGESPKQSYELHTPTATMGIRGTVFDVAVDARDTTRLVTFDGSVRLCGGWGRRRCAIVTGGCTMAQAGAFGRVRAPEDKNERDAAINTLFPFISDQERLGGRFHAATERCGDINPLLLLNTAAAPSPFDTRGTLRGERRRSRDDGGNGFGGGGNNGSGNGGGNEKGEP